MGVIIHIVWKTEDFSTLLRHISIYKWRGENIPTDWNSAHASYFWFPTLGM